MASYVGEGVRVRCEALDPVTREPLDPAPVEAFVDFWAPGTNRFTDDPTFAGVEMAYDGDSSSFFVDMDTSVEGWVKGTWYFRVTVSDALPNWEYGRLRLR